MRTFAELSDLKNRSNSSVARMEASVEALNERIAAFERDKTRSREFTLDAITGAREDLLPTLSAELDRLRGFWTDAATQQKFWESSALLLSRQSFDADPVRDAAIKQGLRSEYADMPAQLLQLNYEDARAEADLPRLWLIFTAGQRMLASNSGLEGAVTMTLDGIEIPEQAGALAAIAVCQSNLGHGEMLFSAAAGLRLDPIRKMNVGRLQQQTSRLVAAAAGIGPADSR